MNNEIKDAFAKAMGLSKEEQEILDQGSDHGYRCRCLQCLRWWVLMGPDGGEEGNYGPFTEAEVKAEQQNMKEKN